MADRPAFLADFLLNFFTVDALKGSRISDRVIEANWLEAVTSSPLATLQLVTAWRRPISDPISNASALVEFLA